MFHVCLTRVPALVISNVSSFVSKWPEHPVDWHHAIALTHLATHVRLSLHQSLLLCHQAHTESQQTRIVEDSQLHIGKVEVPPTMAAAAVEAKITAHWLNVRQNVMHMLSVQRSTCAHPVGGARTGSLVPSTPSQVLATAATARTD